MTPSNIYTISCIETLTLDSKTQQHTNRSWKELKARIEWWINFTRENDECYMK